MSMHVPFLDLAAQYASIKDEIDGAIRDVVESQRFVGGEAVERFEQSLATYCGARHAVGVANGTDALQLALRACNVGAGDEVITAANSFIATAAAIESVGARPVLVDIDPATYNLDPNKIEAALTTKTRAIIPIHLYGQPADMQPILEIARHNALLVIEDAAQAHGAKYQGQRAGSLGDIACFSFYPGKNLGAYGDGGAITTNDATLRDRVLLLRDHGRTSKYEHAVVGFNSRLDTLQAAVLDVKLRHLDQWNQRRQQVAAWYEEELAATDLRLPAVQQGATHVYHLYVVQSPNREALMDGLAQANIGTSIHYPLPLHLQPALSHLGYTEGDMPHTEAAAQRIVSLPIFSEMTRDQVRHVAAACANLLLRR
jgi:dTDP-4-amino-4,6-dideoxygalactose transaminase